MEQIIKGIEKYGEHGYMFVIGTVYSNGQAAPDENDRHYRTNRNGQGLWKWGKNTGQSIAEYQQMYGNCQFELSHDIEKAKKRIMKYNL